MIFQMCGIKQISNRLKSMLFKMQFPDMVQDIKPVSFRSPDPKGHVRYCHHFASVSSKHFNLLLTKYFPSWNQTLNQYYLDSLQHLT